MYRSSLYRLIRHEGKHAFNEEFMLPVGHLSDALIKIALLIFLIWCNQLTWVLER